MSSEREAFERRLEAAVRGYVEAAPTEIDAARLARTLATDVPRTRRLVPRPVWRLPSLGLAWVLVLAALVTMLGMGLFASGALRDVQLLPVPPPPSPALETLPVVVASPPVATPPPTAPASPRTSPPPSASPTPAATPGSSQPGTTTPPIGIVLPSSWFQAEQARFQDALKATGYSAQILSSRDVATEKAAVEALIGQGIKVLIITPQDSAAAAAVADAARAAGVKVIANDRSILDTAAVDYYVTFDNVATGAAQAQYLIDKAGATKGNNLYLYAGAASDNNPFLLLEGAWEKLQPRVADGTFVIRNSSVAAALQDNPTLTRDQQGRIIAQVATDWDANTARYRAQSDLIAAPAGAKGTVFILAPNDTTARAIADVFAADKDVRTYFVTGQDADKASVQYMIDGRQDMTVFKDPRTRVTDVVAAAVAFLEGGTPAATTTFNNGAIDVPATLLASVTVTRDNIQSALIDTGYYLASDFTGSWPGKP
jgi:putative multiple sugar transport system substrate-binding protein